MRLCFVILSVLLCTATVGVTDKADMAVAYINRYSAIALSEMYQNGIPASIKLGQALLESQYGTSELAQNTRNHFGLKCKDYWEGQRYYHPDDDYDEQGNKLLSCFRVYQRVEDSYRDHSNFLKHSPWYKTLFELDRTDYRAWAKGLKKCGYATDPAYPAKLISVIERYELYRFDTQNMQSHDAQVVLKTKWKTDHKPPEPFLIPEGYIMGSYRR